MFANPFGGYQGKFMKSKHNKLGAVLGAMAGGYAARKFMGHFKKNRGHNLRKRTVKAVETPIATEIEVDPELRRDIVLAVPHHIGHVHTVSTNTGNGNTFKRITRSKFRKARNDLPFWKFRDMILPPFKLKGTSYGHFNTSNVTVSEVQAFQYDEAYDNYESGAVPDSKVTRLYGSANRKLGAFMVSTDTGLPPVLFGQNVQQTVGSAYQQRYSTANDGATLRWEPGACSISSQCLYPTDYFDDTNVFRAGYLIDCVGMFEVCHMNYKNYYCNSTNIYNVSAIENYSGQSGRTPFHQLFETAPPILDTTGAIPINGAGLIDSHPPGRGGDVSMGKQGGAQNGLDYKGGKTTHKFKNILNSMAHIQIYECKPKKFLPSHVTPLTCLNSDVAEVQNLSAVANMETFPGGTTGNASDNIPFGNIESRNIPTGVNANASGVGIYSASFTVDSKCPMLLEHYNVGKPVAVKLMPDEEFEYVVNHQPFQYDDKFWLQSNNIDLAAFGGAHTASLREQYSVNPSELYVFNEIDYLPFCTTFLLIRGYGESVNDRTAGLSAGNGVNVVPRSAFCLSHSQDEVHYGRILVPNLPKQVVNVSICNDTFSKLDAHIVNPLRDQLTGIYE